MYMTKTFNDRMVYKVKNKSDITAKSTKLTNFMSSHAIL